MAKKRRSVSNNIDNLQAHVVTQGAPAIPGRAPAQVGSAATDAIPVEVGQGDWTALILASMIFLLPAIGVSSEEMLQDTLKSMVASFAVIGAALLFFWIQRNRRSDLRWHAVVWLPLALMLYALGSMLWSHTYLAGVEAIRWFVFSLIVWLGLNTLSRDRLPYLAEGIHWGAVVASLWTAFQFWFDFSYFPQGPNPASTFVNRNFFAEFVVCTLPFSVYLLAQSRGRLRISLMAFTVGFNIVALMMTGTRGAMSAWWLLLLLVFPLVLVIYRRQFGFVTWDGQRRILACAALLGTVAALGVVHTGNPKLISEGQGTTAFQRAFRRTASISPGDASLNIRVVMWKATARMIQARPLAGIGAGAWEAVLPLYQSEGSQLETDYYVHNEMLQLIAEYGVTGLLFLLALFGYLLIAAWKTLRDQSQEAQSEAPMRAMALASLLALFIVSNIGFPWRLASTGCLFAICLALLAASDARLGIRGIAAAAPLPWKPLYSRVMAAIMLLCLALAVYISQQAATTEQKIVRAVKLSLGITQSRDYNNPKWDATKREILSLTREAIDINPHYRKITPMVADELARWGDWKDAVWIWESVTTSRPYVVAIMSNIARGYAQLGNADKAFEFLARCEKLQPTASGVRSLKVILMSRTGNEPGAALLTKQSLDEGIYDIDLVNAAYVLGMRNGDYDMAIKGLELRNISWPNFRQDAFLKMGSIYAIQKKDDARALSSYRNALASAPVDQQPAILREIPPAFAARL